jgi:methylenetetrahydrofolate dehydrogenase (NADP+)/methenyltetrahydrofolate cyclohydrolase
MELVSCKDYVQIQKDILREKVKTFKRKPKLVVVQVDHDKASNSYVNGKRNDSAEIGVIFEHVEIDSEKYSNEDLVEKLNELNADDNVDGIIVQLPIPDKYNVEELQKCISPNKDVDGFRLDSCFKSCTPKGIIDWLKYNSYNLIGKVVVVLGRSKIVGKPLINMLIDEGATVICCNSHTEFIWKYTRKADLVISAIGKPKHFDFSNFDVYCEIIVDVGINRDENGKLCGDIDSTYFDKYLPNTYVTPVPNGVGLLTRTSLMQNVIEAYELHMK